LELATGEYDVAVVDLDAVETEASTAFAQALRSHAATEEVALIGVSRWPDRRHALLAAGADLAVTAGYELNAAISFITGAAVQPSAPQPDRASIPAATLRTLPERQPPAAADGTANSRALAG